MATVIKAPARSPGSTAAVTDAVFGCKPGTGMQLTVDLVQDLVRQLANEAKQFTALDRRMKDRARQARARPALSAATAAPGSPRGCCMIWPEALSQSWRCTWSCMGSSCTWQPHHNHLLSCSASHTTASQAASRQQQQQQQLKRSSSRCRLLIPALWVQSCWPRCRRTWPCWRGC